jgi:hypothetical protein|nr:MAG TPA: NUMOD4 motif protein [Caudoviricetes sp.]
MLDWKPIKGFEGLYEISNAGNIRSFHSREAKKKISEANKGKHHTDEAREKMSRARRGKKIHKLDRLDVSLQMKYLIA